MTEELNNNYIIDRLSIQAYFKWRLSWELLPIRQLLKKKNKKHYDLPRDYYFLPRNLIKYNFKREEMYERR